MTTFYVAGREVHPAGTVVKSGWGERMTSVGTHYVYVTGLCNGGFVATLNKSPHFWCGFALNTAMPKMFDNVGEAMTYVEAVAALQD
jgi:hypothetical protein